MTNDFSFYQSLKPFTDFLDFTNSNHYSKVPPSWWVVIADIAGSTVAIQNGRYKQVNLIGAASICCMQNLFETTHFPFVFGGDGATFLVPNERLGPAKEELQRLIAFAKANYDLELRVGFVNLSELKKADTTIEVAKFELSPGNYLAQFRGSGLSYAEDLVKSKDPRAILLTASDGSSSPALEGLSCRLKPIAHQNGMILSLMIKPLTKGVDESAVVLKQVLEQITLFLGEARDYKPVDLDRLTWPLFSFSSFFDALKSSGARRLTDSLKTLVAYLVTSFALRFGIQLGAFSPKRYKSELLRNSDFQKFDETLRMIIDCSSDQAQQITDFLDNLFTEGLIVFGSHPSKHSLMTCVVQSATENRHFHFIDGSNGGYALAALQMKAQLKKIRAGQKISA